MFGSVEQYEDRAEDTRKQKKAGEEQKNQQGPLASSDKEKNQQGPSTLSEQQHAQPGLGGPPRKLQQIQESRQMQGEYHNTGELVQPMMGLKKSPIATLPSDSRKWERGDPSRQASRGGGMEPSRTPAPALNPKLLEDFNKMVKGPGSTNKVEAHLKSKEAANSVVNDRKELAGLAHEGGHEHEMKLDGATSILAPTERPDPTALKKKFTAEEKRKKKQMDKEERDRKKEAKRKAKMESGSGTVSSSDRRSAAHRRTSLDPQNQPPSPRQAAQGRLSPPRHATKERKGCLNCFRPYGGKNGAVDAPVVQAGQASAGSRRPSVEQGSSRQGTGTSQHGTGTGTGTSRQHAADPDGQNQGFTASRSLTWEQRRRARAEQAEQAREEQAEQDRVKMQEESTPVNIGLQGKDHVTQIDEAKKTL